MDKKTLYEKAEKAFNQAFEATKQSLKVVSEKAGEAAHVTGLMIEKASLEHKVTKQFAQLGNRVFERVTRDGDSFSVTDPEIEKIIKETKELDAELNRIEDKLEQEKSRKSKPEA